MRPFSLVLASLCGIVGHAFAEEPVIQPVVEADAEVQQYAPQLKQVLKTELHFVRAVCQPAPDDFKKIEAAGDAAFKDVLKRLGELQKKMRQLGQPGDATPANDPRQFIADSLLKAVRETLPAEQAERYNTELTKRREARKRAAVLNMVAHLDRWLALTAEQRTQLVDTLHKEWKDAWVSQLEVFMYGEEFVPLPPEAVVLPVLNARQREIWKSAPPRPTIHIGFAGFNFVQVIDGNVDGAAIEVQEVKP
jgi:hypothetical protein